MAPLGCNYWGAKVQISEDNTKQKMIFLILLSSESTFDREVRGSENREKCKEKVDFSFISEMHPTFDRRSEVRISEENI